MSRVGRIEQQTLEYGRIMKKHTILLISTSLAALLTGCVSNLVESPYKFDSVRPSERTMAHKPYRIEDIYVAAAMDPTRMYEALEKQNARSINAKLNGWLNGTDYAANARAAKEQTQDAFETEKIFASNAFHVDETEITPPMIVFLNSLVRIKSESELSEMGLPDYRLTEDETEPTDQEKMQAAAYASAMLGQVIGQEALDGDTLTDKLAAKYPGLFSDDGTPLRIAIAVMSGPASWRTQFGAGSDNFLDFGVWVWSARSVAGKSDPFPVPTASFSAIHHNAMSMLWPAFVKQTSKDNAFVKGSEAETKAFIQDCLCAAIVEAINNLPEKRVTELSR